MSPEEPGQIAHQRSQGVRGRHPDAVSDLGCFLVDAAGHVLAFDRAMERLTGHRAGDVVGRHKDDLGGHGLPTRPRVLYEGRLDATRSARRTLLLGDDEGGHVEVEAALTPVESPSPRLTVRILRVIARMRAPVSEDAESGLDPLTRLPLAAGLDERLGQALERATLFGGPLSLLLLKIDGFESLERELDSGRRSEIIRRVAGILRASLRESDVVARLPGHRFAMLLESSGRSEARHIAGRIRQTIDEVDFGASSGAPPRALTVSIGAACHPADGQRAAELLERASQALAGAERLGHNRVWCYARRPRVDVAFPVRYDGPTSDSLGTATNLSGSGVFVETRERLNEGLCVGLRLELPREENPIQVIARVTRQILVPLDAENPAGLGFEFDSIAPDDLQRIDAFIGRVRAER